MAHQPTLRAVVCDDDPVVRTVLRNLLEDCHYRVVAETGSAQLAIDEIDGRRIDVVIVDLSLQAGEGEDVLRYVRDNCSGETDAVVFSGFVDNVEDLVASGAVAVFEKPEFGDLEGWLRGRAERPPTTDAESPGGRDRRRPAQPAPVLPERSTTSPSELEPWHVVRDCVDRLWPGDAILAIDLLDVPKLREEGDELFVLDHRLALGRLVAPSLRRLDRIAATPMGVIVCLLVAGHPEAPVAVFDRLQIAWDLSGANETPIGSFGHVRADEHPDSTLERVLRRIGDGQTAREQPLRLA